MTKIANIDTLHISVKVTLIVISLLLLQACGGGSGSDSEPPSSTPTPTSSSQSSSAAQLSSVSSTQLSSSTLQSISSAQSSSAAQLSSVSSTQFSSSSQQSTSSVQSSSSSLQPSLYTQEGTDPTWAEILATDALRPLYTFTDKGVLGSTISINRALIETGEYGSRPINSAEKNYSLHAVGNPAIGQGKFNRWSRWYQEDGNTQIFRLFKDEENVSNSRALAARVEISSPDDRWLPQPGVWREFSARFTVVKAKGCSALPEKDHYCSIFQAKGNNVDHWSVMLRVHGDGSLWFYPRENINKGKIKIRDNVIGKPFDMKVRDNGLDYEMWIDGVSVGSGQWQRTLEIGFRWGIYVGETQVVDDVMVFVTGVKMN